MSVTEGRVSKYLPTFSSIEYIPILLSFPDAGGELRGCERKLLGSGATKLVAPIHTHPPRGLTGVRQRA